MGTVVSWRASRKILEFRRTARAVPGGRRRTARSSPSRQRTSTFDVGHPACRIRKCPENIAMTVVDRKTSRPTAGDRKLVRSWQPGRVVCQNDRKRVARPAVDRRTSRLTGDDGKARPKVVV